jgi:hypothetical protein
MSRALLLLLMNLLPQVDPGVYARFKALVDEHQPEAPVLDTELARVASRASEILRQCGATHRGAARAAVAEGLREIGRFGLAYLAIEASDTAELLARTRDYLSSAPLLPRIEAIGVTDDTPGVVVLARPRIELPRLPPEAWRAKEVLLWGRLQPGYRAPEVLVMSPGAKVSRHRPRLEGRLFYQPLDGGAGPVRVEIQAEGPHGQEVLALFDAGDHGSDPCAAFRLDAAPTPAPRDPHAAEAAMLRWINAERAAHGLGPLARHAEATVIARLHSKDMAAGDFIGHRSPRHGVLADRLRRARLPFAKAVENVAVASDVRDAHRELSRTPSHVANMLLPEAETVGVGIIRHGEVYYVTQIFIAPR